MDTKPAGIDHQEQAEHVEFVAQDVYRLRAGFVNLYLVGTPERWILVDAGLKGNTGPIVRAGREVFGASPPRAIILTHGHFDHTGAFPTLFEVWDVPVYAHPLELPHLTGKADYPEPDPSVGMGVMAMLSFAYPNKSIDLGDHIQELPPEGRIPAMPEWEWIHTPGHTEGHVSLFRKSDRVLIAGDAFVTTRQESLYAVVTQKEEVHGPPAYFTPDWDAARTSVQHLASLHPSVAATGHGKPMRGSVLDAQLTELAFRFDELAIPARGKYVTR